MKENLFYALSGLRNFLVYSLNWCPDSKLIQIIDDIRYKFIPEDYE